MVSCEIFQPTCGQISCSVNCKQHLCIGMLWLRLTLSCLSLSCDKAEVKCYIEDPIVYCGVVCILKLLPLGMYLVYLNIKLGYSVRTVFTSLEIQCPTAPQLGVFGTNLCKQTYASIKNCIILLNRPDIALLVHVMSLQCRII